MPEATLPSKELAELQRRFKRGYGVERQTNGHYRVTDPDGEYVRKPGKDSYFSLSGTPSRGVAKSLVHELEEAGVLRQTRQKRTRTQTANGETRRVEALRAMQAARGEIRGEEALRLYERLSAVLKNLGGFEQPGMPSDLSHIGALIARETGKIGRHGTPFTPDLLISSIHRVKNKQWVEPGYQEVWNDIAARLEAAKDTTAEFFLLLRRSKGLPETATQIETKAKVQVGDWPFRVELIDLFRCVIDHSYQRPVDWLWVRKHAAIFDPTLVGTLDVSERHAGATFAIMDGQGRTEMMKLVGKSQAYAAIYSGLDIQAEASFFLHKNQDRKAIHPFYTFNAKLTAKDPTAIEVKRIVERYGYEVSITSASTRHIPEKISAISSLEEAFKRSNENVAECLSPTLACLRASTFGLKEGNSAQLIRAVARLFERYQDIDEHRLAETIGQRGPTWLLARSRELGWNTGNVVTPALVVVLVEEYNHGLPRGQKLVPPRK